MHCSALRGQLVEHAWCAWPWSWPVRSWGQDCPWPMPPNCLSAEWSLYLHGRTVEVQCAALLFFSRQGSAHRRLSRPAQLFAAHAPAGRHLRFLYLRDFAEVRSDFRLRFVQRVIAAYRASFFLPVSRGSWFRAFLTQYGFLTHYSYLAVSAPGSALSCAARYPPLQLHHGAYFSPRGR